MSKQKVLWTPIGLNSLKEIQSFILEHWNEQVLEHFLDLVDRRIEQLRLNPKLAPTINSSKYRKLVIHKNISIFYINERTITKILLVWDNRQNPIHLKRKLTDANIV